MRKPLLVAFLLLTAAAQAQLDENWIGHYQGELTSVNLAGQESTFGMELRITERQDSTYDFTIIYTAKEVLQERAYQLIPDGKNHFLLDERNGIIVDMSFGKDRLVSLFEVQNNFIHVSYILTKKGVRFELTSSVPAKITGGSSEEDGQEIPEVQAYKAISFQYAFLKRQK